MFIVDSENVEFPGLENFPLEYPNLLKKGIPHCEIAVMDVKYGNFQYGFIFDLRICRKVAPGSVLNVLKVRKV